MLHCTDNMRAGDSRSTFDCYELQAAVSDDVLQSMLLSLWDDDALEVRKDCRCAPADKRTKNRWLAQQARNADKEYLTLMLKELESFTETFEIYSDYTQELKLHATGAVTSTVSLEQICAESRINVAKLQEGDKCTAAEPMTEIPRRQRNRIHAQNSRKRKLDLLEDLIRQRDESWATFQDVMQHTTALESACSVINDFDDHGDTLLELTAARQRLLMRTSAHKQKCEELKCLLSYRAIYREKNAA